MNSSRELLNWNETRLRFKFDFARCSNISLEKYLLCHSINFLFELVILANRSMKWISKLFFFGFFPFLTYFSHFFTEKLPSNFPSSASETFQAHSGGFLKLLNRFLVFFKSYLALRDKFSYYYQKLFSFHFPSNFILLKS